jgi:putative heme-binding domain-containing protein
MVSTFDSVTVWHNGRALSQHSPTALQLNPGSNDLLVRVESRSRSSSVALQFRAAGRVEAVLPENLGLGSLAERLKSGRQNQDRDLREFLKVDWQATVNDGDAERGRKLFGADGLSCIKCHGILPNQNVRGAPSLANAGKRFTVPHLVESILLPSKQVAPLFRATLVATVDGKTLSGLTVEEDDENVVLLLPNGSRQKIAKDQIDVRKQQEISPMPAGVVKTPAELRDLLAYLRSETIKAP